MKKAQRSQPPSAADRHRIRKDVRAYLVRLARVVGPWEACTIFLIEGANLAAQLESPPAAALRLTAVAEALVNQFEAGSTGTVN